jgi:ketosteroid isomerase-like protein
MGDAEVRVFSSWMQRVSTLDSPSDAVDLWYEHIWAPDIDYRAIEGAPDDVGPITGRDAMRAYFEDWFDMFPDLVTAPAEIVDVGPERVMVVWHVTGTAKASGIPTDMRVATVYTIRGGKIVRGREYITKDDALAAIAGVG